MRVLARVVLLVLIVNVIFWQGSDSKAIVELLAKEFAFKASFTYKFPSFIALLNLIKSHAFKSPVFSAKNDRNVTWYFLVETGDPQRLFVKLFVASLPPNTESISGRVECGLIDLYGKKVHVASSNESIIAGSYFGGYTIIDRSTLEKSAKDLLPDGRLTLNCDIDCVLLHNFNATKGLVPSIEVATPPKVLNESECGERIALDTLSRLSLFDDSVKRDAELKSSDKTFACHSAILRERMTLFNFSGTTSDGKTVYDLSGDLNAEQLEGFVTFLYRGKAPNLEKNCRVFFKVAKKYGIDCLLQTCQRIMINDIMAGHVNCVS